MHTIPLHLLILLSSFGFQAPPIKPEVDCLNCHKALVGQSVVHTVAESCDNCHVSNTKAHPQQGVKGFTLTEDVPDICYTCHDKVQADIQNTSHIHKVIYGKKSCTACHSPHSSAQPKLLIAEEKVLCLSCHNRAYVTDSSRSENIKQMIDNGKSVHAAIDGGGCIACHSPHASTRKALLKDAYPKSIYAEGNPDNYALCFTCHDNQLMTADTTTSATQFRNGNKNMHYLHLHGTKGRSCAICHNMHASGNLHLINDSFKFGDWDMPIRFNHLENGGSCYPGCHSEKTYRYAN